MPLLLRTLEDWTTHQDYLWFLAALAWLIVAFGISRADRRASGDQTWLLVFAFTAILGAALELVLCAQNLSVPYTKFDFAMGLTDAAGVAALSWPWLERRWRKSTVRIVTLLAALLSAALRVPWPTVSGTALAVLGIVCAGLAGTRWLLKNDSLSLEPLERRLLVIGTILAGLLPLIATHGPLALAAHEPRINSDFSHFALFAAGFETLAGGLIAFALWRARLRDLHGRAELGRSLALLALWFVVGLAFAVWTGRQARRVFEQSLLSRAVTAATLLEPAMLRAALGSDLKVTAVRTRPAPNNLTHDWATMPHTLTEAVASLRPRLHRVQQASPDVASVYIEIIRDDLRIIPVTRSLMPTYPGEGAVYGKVTPADLARLEAKTAFLEGPVTNEWGTHFYAKAPLLDGPDGKILGWLVLNAAATRWTVSFTQTRLQAMALVGLGVGLWGLAIAYRLRRAESVAADQRAAAAADRMKSTFLAKVSHELRTPIQSVLGYCDLLLREPIGEPHRRWLGALHAHGELMLRLVNDLLDLGSLQAGAFKLRNATVQLPELVADCVAALRPQAEAKGLSLTLDLAPAVPCWVETDAVRLRQILLNLLANAVKFTVRGQVRLTVRLAAQEVEFVVADTGPGIPSDKRAALFQPFMRLDDQATTEGSGLGLALVTGLCTAMGGSVACHENPEAGATFVVRLPLPAQSERDAAATRVSATAAYRELRVVLAEDNVLVRDLLETFLRRNGAEVTAVSDGAAAVKACASAQPDIVILDVAMPKLDGLAAARAIRQLPSGTEPRPWVIGLSAHAQPADETNALAAGMDRFLVKPVSLDRLDDTLRLAPKFHQRPAAVRVATGLGDLRESMLAHYRRETPTILIALRQAVLNRDWPTVAAHSHYLKNSADILEAAELRLACEALHTWCLNPGDPVHVATLLASVESAAQLR